MNASGAGDISLTATLNHLSDGPVDEKERVLERATHEDVVFLGTQPHPFQVT
ncbi:MAG: hypothetical protein M3441_26085 [Chloroflexota bacterium]|nr:hypothetical protein [Chloroflexota bacterium]